MPGRILLVEDDQRLADYIAGGWPSRTIPSIARKTGATDCFSPRTAPLKW